MSNLVACKGDLLLGTGCKECTKCQAQAYDLANRYLAGEKEKNSPENRTISLQMEHSGVILAQAIRLAQGDMVGAQIILKIAMAGAETVTQMESIRSMMSDLMKGSRS